MYRLCVSAVVCGLLAVGQCQLFQRPLFGQAESEGINLPTIQESNNAIASTVNEIFETLGLPFSFQTPVTRREPERASGIGMECQTTSNCKQRNLNSVCFDGHCLCNLGFHYVSELDNCLRDNVCLDCQNHVNTCIGGQDVFCNGSCFADYRTEQVARSNMQVTSPNWPEDYPAKTDKFICLQAAGGKMVHLDLMWIDLETGCGHSCDYIKVYDGCVAEDNKNLLSFYTGDNAGNRVTVTSKCNKMLIHFHSDQDEQEEISTMEGGEVVEVLSENRLARQAAELEKRKNLEVFLKNQREKLQSAQNLNKEELGQKISELKSQINHQSKDQRSGFMGYYREVDYGEATCKCAN